MKISSTAYRLIFFSLGFLSLLAGLPACKPTPAPTEIPAEIPVVAAHFPESEIEIPTWEEPVLILPKASIDTILSPHKAITKNFSSREINHIAVQDAQRFAQGNTEIIDLTLIQPDDYAFPLPGGKVISPYGGKRRYHSGTDIKTRPNDTIVAAFDGIVRMAKPYSAYGNVIVIRHYNGLETVYSHNSKNLVKPGDEVKAGTPIALTGRTGRATTEHLHFEVRFNGVHFNPNYIFRFRTQTLQRNYLICKRHKNGSITVSPVKKQDAFLVKDLPKTLP